MVIEQARVLNNDQVAQGIYSLQLLAPRITSQYQGPGQFVSLTMDGGWEHPLRRPMSIAEVEGETLTLLYKPVGVVTNLLTTLKPFETLNLLGPRGNTFILGRDDEYPILVGGGTGLAPILNLHSWLQKHGRQHTVILGARTAGEHFHSHEPQNQFFLTTDDGSLGNSGTVIPTLKEQLRNHPQAYVYACGPVPMLAAVQDIAKEYGIPAQVSVESYLACSMGLCQSCVIKRKVTNSQEHSYHQRYSLVCEDGPVYPGEEVVFD
jgi:dihydroorotate dehydrogenase electron transfer subunit